MVSHYTKVSKDLNKYFLNEQIRALCVIQSSRVQFLSTTHVALILEVRRTQYLVLRNHSTHHGQQCVSQLFTLVLPVSRFTVCRKSF